VGATPCTTADLPEGEYLVVLRRDGYVSQRAPVRIDGDDTTDAPITLGRAGFAPPELVRVDAARPFWILEREITGTEYLAFVNDPETVARLGDERRLVPRSATTLYWDKSGDGTYELGEDWMRNEAVVGVSYEDALAYVAWRSQRDGRAYALPTAREWRIAATLGTRRKYPFGNVFLPKWVSSNWARVRPRLHAAMRFPIDESPAGVYDMSGNAMEWIDSGFGDPRVGLRRLAGGSWGLSRRELFSVVGGWGAHPDAASGNYGFRIVLREQE
jgi:formylglycine-generating enzyme required for sulfatase activity